MIAKSHRMTRREFSEVFAHGERFHCNTATLIYQPSPVFKTAVAVGGKITKQKPLRNTIRRRVYDIMQIMHKKDGITGSYIFLIKKDALTHPYAELADSIQTLLTNI